MIDFPPIWKGRFSTANTRCGDPVHDTGIFEVGQHDRELVAAQPGEVQTDVVAPGPRNDIAGAQLLLQALGHGLQQEIAGAVAERIVDALEAVQIEEQKGQLAVPAARMQQLAVGALEEVQPVRHPGQRVEIRQPPNPFFVEL